MSRLLSQHVKIFFARHRNLFYVRSEKLLALLSPGNELNVLMFVRQDWAEAIRRGFRRTPYRVEFGEITSASLDRFDVVVPLTHDDLESLRRNSGKRKNRIAVPSKECERLCNDKMALNQCMIRGGFGAYIPKMGRELTPPYILKKRIGEWGADCHIIRDLKDEQTFSQQLNDPAYFCQELIGGPSEFATHILFMGGRIVKALNVMYEFETETPIKGQSRILYMVIRRCPYLSLFTKMLGTINFEGLCCVNYKMTRGQPFLLEINPRFGGSLAPYFFSFLRHLC
jgi:hypothetical protein